MSNEDFKELYKDSPPIEKLNVLIETIRNESRADYRAGESITRNPKEAQYWENEYHAMGERIDWLYDDLKTILDKE